MVEHSAGSVTRGELGGDPMSEARPVTDSGTGRRGRARPSDVAWFVSALASLAGGALWVPLLIARGLDEQSQGLLPWLPPLPAVVTAFFAVGLGHLVYAGATHPAARRVARWGLTAAYAVVMVVWGTIVTYAAGYMATLMLFLQEWHS